MAFVMHVDFLVGRAEGCCLGGGVTSSNWTHADPLATVVCRFPLTWGGSKSTLIGSVWPMGLASVVECILHFFGADGPADLRSALTATSRARRPVKNAMCSFCRSEAEDIGRASIRATLLVPPAMIARMSGRTGAD